MVLCSWSNIWDGRDIRSRGRVLVLLESTVIKFVWSTGKLSFSEKSKFEGEECLLLQDEHIIVLCFYFSCWLMKCILSVENEKYLCLSERRQTICGSFKINTTSWVLHSECENACVLFILTMICFAFFWWQEWQVQDSVTVLGHFQHRFWLFGNTP